MRTQIWQHILCIRTICVSVYPVYPQPFDLNRTHNIMAMANLHLHAHLATKWMYLYNKLPATSYFRSFLEQLGIAGQTPAASPRHNL